MKIQKFFRIGFLIFILLISSFAQEKSGDSEYNVGYGESEKE